MGDPIADQYALSLYFNMVLVAVADGCSWGERPRLAARHAACGFLEFMTEEREKEEKEEKERGGGGGGGGGDTGKLGERMLKACTYAHQKITERKDAGTATLCGGVLVQSEEGEEGEVGGGGGGEEKKKGEGGKKWKGMVKKKKERRGGGVHEWAFVCVNVGDCKAILFSRKKNDFIDITRGNRLVKSDFFFFF